MRRCRAFPAGSTSPGCLRQPATGSLRSCWLSFLHSHMRASPRLNFGVWRSRRQYTLSRSAGVHIITDGSSIPRGRGSPKAVQARDGFDRFTPARAGQASRPRAKSRRSWAYPRARGAAVTGRSCPLAWMGSSPRMRGASCPGLALRPGPSPRAGPGPSPCAAGPRDAGVNGPGTLPGVSAGT